MKAICLLLLPVVAWAATAPALHDAIEDGREGEALRLVAQGRDLSARGFETGARLARRHSARAGALSPSAPGRMGERGVATDFSRSVETSAVMGL